ncbi:uncharacterized protein JCM15063_002341 [Sporobolomyces koalae]|uniref:uncharacterized protein n=1 Tax=Sporobolomyces koalae TaxID=500713 RepID=UPI0031713162
MAARPSSPVSVSHASTRSYPASEHLPSVAPLYTSNSFDSVNTLAPSDEQACVHSFPSAESTPPPPPSRPLSFIESCEYDGPTRVGSPEPELVEDKKDKFEKQLVRDEEEAHEKVVMLDNEFPEGGTRAWLALAGSTLVLTCTFSISNSFATFLNYYKLHQLAAYDTSKISWIGSCHLFITFGSAFLAGVLFDKGYFRYQLAFGSIFWVIGLACLSICHSFIEIFLCQSLCMGIALGAMFAPCLSVLGTYFKRKRAFVVGVAASGTAVGAVCFPIMLEHLFVRVGFKLAVLYLAILQLVVLVIANCITRPRQLASNTTTAPRPPLVPVLRRIARQPAAWLVCVGTFGIMICLFIPLFYIITYTRDVAKNELLADYALAIINAAMFVSRIGAGLVADRIGIFNTALPLGILVGIMTFVLPACTSTAALVIFMLLTGLASGGFVSCSASVFMALSEDVSEIGLRSGVGFFFIGLASLIGSPAAGALLKATGGYIAACSFGGACCFVGCALLFLGRLTQVRRRASQWV